MEQIKRGIYIEDSYLGVTLGALVLSHGTILIDAPIRPEDARSWRSALLNQRGGTSRMMVSLDSHLDRTLGAKALECTIISHHKTAQVFRSRPMIFKGQGLESGADWETYAEVIGTRWASPDITFTDSLQLHWGGPLISLVHRPGPAPGSIWVVLPEPRLVFTGDLVVKDQPPFFGNADLGEWMHSIDVYQQQYSGFTMISGRGGLVGESEITRQRGILEKLNIRIQALGQENASPEATEALIPELLDSFGTPPRQREKHTQRLRYGLNQYYSRRFRPVSQVELESFEEEPE